MPILIYVFAVSLFLIALFFAMKEREVYSGKETPLTRFLVRHSPRFEGYAHRMGSYGSAQVKSSHVTLASTFAKTKLTTVATARYIVVLVAEKMIHAVRGEKLLSVKGAPSMYLKQLREKGDVSEEKPKKK